jgi:hypothetical protein
MDQEGKGERNGAERRATPPPATNEEWAMLRITIHDAPPTLTFRLEGRLAGPWVGELEECWRGALVGRGEPILRVDLTGVTIDAAGRACLAAAHGRGAEFVAADDFKKAVADEITRTPVSDCGPPK